MNAFSVHSRITHRHGYASNAFSVLAFGIAVAFATPALAQTNLSGAGKITPAIRAKLSQRVSLELRDATLLEALFTVRDESGLNIVVGNEVTGTVNASYENSTVFDILDSLLITRGYGYRVVGESLAIVPLSSLGDQLPLFETQVVGLKSSVADDLLPSIESMLSPEGRVHAVRSSNSLVLVDYPERIEKIRSHVTLLEEAAVTYQLAAKTPDATSRTDDRVGLVGLVGADELIVRVLKPQYVNATVLADAIAPLLSVAGKAAAIDLEDKLVVTDTAAHMQRIELALSQLDQPRPQVRIWAMIYDCGIEDLERLGVNWRGGANGSSIDSASGNPAQSIVLDSVTSAVATGSNGVLTLSSLNNNINLRSVIQALNTADDSRLLADPNVVVMNHEPAEIAIVTEVPYQQLTQGLEGGTIGTTEFREAGVTLNVTPHIAQDDTIALLVNPQFSLLTGFSEPDNAPIIDRRETKTTVRVTNNQTIVLGGLRQRTRITNRSAIPLLGKVPYVGSLFRHRSSTARESELLVFITPQIVLPDYLGTRREDCLSRELQVEVDRTPTDPVPFGIDAVLAEARAHTEMINHPNRIGPACRANVGACRCSACTAGRTSSGIDQGMIRETTQGMIGSGDCDRPAIMQHGEGSVSRPVVIDPSSQQLTDDHSLVLPAPTLEIQTGVLETAR
ncbi:secretin N-terminal domain-containing protein [Planctomycetes bacterium K23_9]|uniref:Type II secretion system protein D n=1 Tax=Stieleria marina TaxID=1930275 RepID=A0A517NWB9_9BACT|nr:Type II secretion system protein D precursor [Planctomycetes bacterium K23_9]